MAGISPETNVDDIDVDIRKFVDGISQGYANVSGLADMTLNERRAVAEKIRVPWRSGGPEMAETREISIGGMRGRLHRPTSNAVLPVLLYIHGGGWTLFSIDTHDRLMREYAARAGVCVVGIDYSLSPEHKFPVALHQVVDTIEWLQTKAGELGIDPDKVAIGGDSAGANLSVSACLELRRRGGKLPQALLLSYGAFGSAATASYARYDGPDYCLEVNEMKSFWENYRRSPADHENPLVEPEKADLSGMPPAFLAIAECDILADSNREFAKKLEAAGGVVEAVVYEGATHSFLEAASIAPLARRALDEQSDWLRSQLIG